MESSYILHCMGKRIVQIGYSLTAMIFVAFLALVVGMGIQAIGGFLPIGDASGSVSLVRQAPGPYHYISPLLMVDVEVPGQAREVAQLRSRFTSLIQTARKKGEISSASIFFRDFSDGRWVSINPNDQYSPASLLKIPLMVSVLKLAESDPTVLSQKILYDGRYNFNELEGVFAPSRPLVSGTYYSVEELLRHMTAYSDNNAVYLLKQFVDDRLENEVYTDLGLSIPPKTTDISVDFMTVKNYASFFRVLFSSTYLSRAYSEKALSFLAESDFTQGIRGGVPAGMDVANKYGERTQYDSAGKIANQELHDCGIVYYPEHPYLLCVMTKAPTFAGASSFIRSISHTAYEFVQ